MNRKQKCRVIRLATYAVLGSSIVPLMASGADNGTALSFDKKLVGNTITLTNIDISSKSDSIEGIKIYFGLGYDKANPSIEYNLRGKNYTSTEQQLIINETLTPEEVEEVLASLKITRGNPASFQLSIRLNSGEEEDCVYNPSNGHYYKFVYDYGVTWEQAKERANKQYLLGERGYLVTLTSKDEQEIFNSLTPNSVWLGGSDAEEEGKWKWVTGPEAGQELTYTNWKANEPNNEFGVEHCMQSVKAFGGTWNDTTNEGAPESWDGGSLYPTGYIVEFGRSRKLDKPDIPYEDTIIVDTLPPVIKGNEDKIVYVNEELNLMENVTATDDIDGDITSKVIEADDVDYKKPGVYNVEYYVEDSEGNSASATSSITVLEIDEGTPPIEENDDKPEILPPTPPIEENNDKPEILPPTPPIEENDDKPWKPPTEEVIPPIEEIEPPIEEVTPPIEEEVTPPIGEEVTPPIGEEVTPPIEGKPEVIPPIGEKPEVTPPIEEDTKPIPPIMEDDKPIPPTEEVIPPTVGDKTEEVLPPSNGGLIPGSSGSGSNVLPQTGTVMSSGVLAGILAIISGSRIKRNRKRR